MKLIGFLLMIAILSNTNINAQILEMENNVDIVLSDGIEVKIHKKSNSTTGLEYYYLPTQLRFSSSVKNEPEFSILEYKNSDGSTRAIMHFLITWGLNKHQLEEAQDSLSISKGIEAKLMGAIMPEPMDTKKGFTISGNSPLVNILNNSITGIGGPATIANSKIAASFHFNSEDSQAITAAINENSKDLKRVVLTLPYLLVLKEKRTGKYIKTEFKLKNNLFNLLN